MTESSAPKPPTADDIEFDRWWHGHVPTPAQPEIDLYPTSPSMPRRLYYSGTESGMRDAFKAGCQSARERELADTDAVARHIVGMVEGLARSNTGRVILRKALEG